MGRQNSFSCLILLVLILYCSLSSPRRPGAGNKKYGKTTDLSRGAKKRPKVTHSPVLGQLFFRGKELDVNLNFTEEYELYTANLYKFPDGLHYPRPSQLNDAAGLEEFISSCLNTTIEKNKVWISGLEEEEEGDIYMSVGMQVLQFLCLENYLKLTNGAVTCTGGLWAFVGATYLLYYSEKELIKEN
ncbi:hypothetical protein XELAEV_18020332mg [Xenopus laevis]|uniref:Prion/Doppel protein beta-ribbon domain-containing protein n=1 Tax=Xenopus laevis TaxID=8355 RepID=A0A974D7L5_XENLA|nr:hypothetical protein XELAEV_18020332mg [Xenopus laevis]